MERRNWSLEAFNHLKYIDTLDDEERALSLQNWVEKYLTSQDTLNFDLEYHEMEILLELFYKNINFMKTFTAQIHQQMVETRKMKAFLVNS